MTLPMDASATPVAPPHRRRRAAPRLLGAATGMILTAAAAKGLYSAVSGLMKLSRAGPPPTPSIQSAAQSTPSAVSDFSSPEDDTATANPNDALVIDASSRNPSATLLHGSFVASVGFMLAFPGPSGAVIRAGIHAGFFMVRQMARHAPTVRHVRDATRMIQFALDALSEADSGAGAASGTGGGEIEAAQVFDVFTAELGQDKDRVATDALLEAHRVCFILDACGAGIGTVWNLCRLRLEMGQQPLIALGGHAGCNIKEGQVWRLLTHAFLENNYWDLQDNMTYLNEVGPKVERALGCGTILVYGLGALGGGLALLALPPAAAEPNSESPDQGPNEAAGQDGPVFFGPTASRAAMECVAAPDPSTVFKRDLLHCIAPRLIRATAAAAGLPDLPEAARCASAALDIMGTLKALSTESTSPRDVPGSSSGSKSMLYTIVNLEEVGWARVGGSAGGLVALGTIKLGRCIKGLLQSGVPADVPAGAAASMASTSALTQGNATDAQSAHGQAAGMLTTAQ